MEVQGVFLMDLWILLLNLPFSFIFCENWEIFNPANPRSGQETRTKFGPILKIEVRWLGMWKMHKPNVEVHKKKPDDKIKMNRN